MNDQISAKQLERSAFIYIHQSTLQQVRHNLESHRRRYELQNRAKELGFHKIMVIDDNLGIPGTFRMRSPSCGCL